ncbi:MAG: PDZ domain-containing protein [Verrucomicrobiota bacterium]
MSKLLKWIWLVGISGSAGLGGQSLEEEFRRKGDEVREAFEPIREVLQASSAVLYSGSRASGYGVVMTEDGYLLAKASEVEEMEDLLVRVGRKSYERPQVVGVDQNWDVVLLKVDGEGFVPVDLFDEEPLQGTMVFSNSGTSRLRRRAQFGVISAHAREIGGAGLAVLGIMMELKDEEVVVTEVPEGGGAAEAGVEVDDVVLELNGEEIAKAEDLVAGLKGQLPGAKVAMLVRRGEEEVELVIELSERGEVFEEQLNRNDMMSGEFSKRRTNFPRVLQHDTPLAQRTVGGPLLDLKGRCVGMNIAFASREASYAIPAAEMRKLLEELRAQGDGI